MKKTLAIILTLGLCFALVSGCASKKDPVEQTQTPTQTSDSGVITPLPETIDINALDDCTVSVSVKKGDIFVDDGQLKIKAMVYSYDLYDMVDIASLEVGDTILRLGKEVEVTELNRLETGLIQVNGGEEKGGFDLAQMDNTVYYEIGMNDRKAFYELGEVTLPVSDGFVYTDSSDLDNDPVEYSYDDFVSDDMDIEYHFVPSNTQLVIADGFVVAMNRIYIP